MTDDLTKHKNMLLIGEHQQAMNERRSNLRSVWGATAALAGFAGAGIGASALLEDDDVSKKTVAAIAAGGPALVVVGAGGHALEAARRNTKKADDKLAALKESGVTPPDKKNPYWLLKDGITKVKQSKTEKDRWVIETSNEPSRERDR